MNDDGLFFPAGHLIKAAHQRGFESYDFPRNEKMGHISQFVIVII